MLSPQSKVSGASPGSPSKTARRGKGASGGLVAGFAPALVQQHAKLRQMMDSQPALFRASRSYARFAAPAYAKLGATSAQPATGGAHSPTATSKGATASHRSPGFPLPSPTSSIARFRSFSRASSRSEAGGRSPPVHSGQFTDASASTLSAAAPPVLESDPPSARLRRAVLLGDAPAAKRAVRAMRAEEQVAARAAARLARSLARSRSPPVEGGVLEGGALFSPRGSVGSASSTVNLPSKPEKRYSPSPQPSHRPSPSPQSGRGGGGARKTLTKKRSLRLTLPSGHEVDLERGAREEGAGGADPGVVRLQHAPPISPGQPPHRHFLRSSTGRRAHVDTAERSLLHLAAARGDGPMVRVLLQAGEDPLVRTLQGLLPLQVAMMHQSTSESPATATKDTAGKSAVELLAAATREAHAAAATRKQAMAGAPSTPSGRTPRSTRKQQAFFRDDGTRNTSLEAWDSMRAVGNNVASSDRRGVLGGGAFGSFHVPGLSISTGFPGSAWPHPGVDPLGTMLDEGPEWVRSVTAAVPVPPPAEEAPPPATGLLSPSVTSLRVRTASLRAGADGTQGQGLPWTPASAGAVTPSAGSPLATRGVPDAFGAGGRYVRRHDTVGEEVFLDTITGKEHSAEKVRSVEFLVALMVGRHFEPQVMGDKVRELSGVRGHKARTVARMNARALAAEQGVEGAGAEGGGGGKPEGPPAGTKLQKAAEESALLSELEGLQARHDRALWRGVAQGAMRRVRSLLQQGQGQVHWANAAEYGYSCLHKAAQVGDHDILALLVQLGGGDVNVSTPDGGVTPLHIACWRGHTRACRLLLAAGARVSARDAFHDTPLHDACEGGHGMIVRLLLTAPSAGAVILDSPNQQGWTPLHKAAASGHAQCLRELLLGTLRTAVRGALEAVQGEAEGALRSIHADVRCSMLEEEQKSRAEARAAVQRARRLGAKQAEAEQLAAPAVEGGLGTSGGGGGLAAAETRAPVDRTSSAGGGSSEATAALERSADLRALLVAQRHSSRPVSAAEEFFVAVTYAAWAFHCQLTPGAAGGKGGGSVSEVPLQVPESHHAALRVVARLQATLHQQAASGHGGGLTARQRATVRATRVPPPRVSQLLIAAAEAVLQPPSVQSAAAFASTGLHTAALGSRLGAQGGASSMLELQGGCPGSTPALLQCIVRSTRVGVPPGAGGRPRPPRGQGGALWGAGGVNSGGGRAGPAAGELGGGHSAHQLASLGRHGACVGLLELAVRCVLAGQSHAEGVLGGTVPPEQLPTVQTVHRWGGGEEESVMHPPSDDEGGCSPLPMSASMANVLQVMGGAGTGEGGQGGDIHRPTAGDDGVHFTWADAEALADAQASLASSVGVAEEGDAGGLHGSLSLGSALQLAQEAGAGSGLVGALSLLRRQRSQRQAQAEVAAAARAALLRRGARAKVTCAALAAGMPLPSEGRGGVSPRSGGGGSSPLRGGSAFRSQSPGLGRHRSPSASGWTPMSRRQLLAPAGAAARGRMPVRPPPSDAGRDTGTFLTRLP